MPTVALKGYPNDRQIDFFKANSRHIAYGGARGGGKSWAMRRKFVLLALRYDGLKLLLMRRTLPELRENHVMPLLAELQGIARYKETEKVFIFPNGSRLKLGYCDNEKDVFQYQGQEYDVIGLEEATHFTDSMRDFLITCNRTTRTDFTPRMYYTSNPGNVGHVWFKRLFIDQHYRGKEKSNDYVFIPAKVYDNKVLMENNPEYVEALESLPDELRRAMLEGDWDSFAGQYFTEFNRDTHVVEPFTIPPEWRRYITLDYGLDMLACYWIAIDTHNKAYVYRELYQSSLIISDATKAILKLNGADKVYQGLAPPDLWNRRQETGKSAADLFRENGLSLIKANNNRVQGWYNLKEWLKPYNDEQGIKTSSIVFFKNCTNIIRCLPQLQYDEHNPNDVANEPHELTHGPDAIRYFIAGRPRPNVQEQKKKRDDFFARDKEDSMELNDSYINMGR